MSNNIYDTVNQLERDIRALPAYQDLKAAFAAIQADEATHSLFEKFKSASMAFQTAQMAGEAPSDEDIQQLQALSEQVQANDAIKQLMTSEQSISQILNDINAIVTKPLQELYNN